MGRETRGCGDAMKEQKDMISVDEFISKYLGTHAGKGHSACFRFCKAALKAEFGIEMDEDYLEMLNHFRPTKEPRYGDIVMMSIRPPVTDHIGIYLRDGAFMHCGLRDEVIISRAIDGRYGSRIVGYLRYRG